jgi:hypothetical protein
MQPKLIILAAALVGSAVAVPIQGMISHFSWARDSALLTCLDSNIAQDGASLENLETASWYAWDKRDGASLENVETAAWYGWIKRALGLAKKKDGASLENVETAAWYGWI